VASRAAFVIRILANATARTGNGPRTYKTRGKTVNGKLDSETGPLYQAACRQYRRLKALLNRLERISRTALAAQAKQLKNRRIT